MRKITLGLATLIAAGSLLAPALSLAQIGAPQSQEAEAPKGPKITVTSTGEGTKHQLRLKPAVGLKQTVVMTTSMNQKMSMNGMPMEMAMPDTHMTMVFEVTDINDAGDITFGFEYTEATVGEGGNPMMTGPMRDAMQQMVGVKGISIVSSQGHTKSATFEDLDSLDPVARQTLEGLGGNIGQMTIPFPEEAVGVGAKWTAEQNIEMQGIKINQNTTLEVVRIQDGEVELKTIISQTAPEQTIDAGEMGGTVTLKSMKSSGVGMSIIRLNLVAPARAESDVSSEMSLVMDMQGQNMSMNQTSEVKSKIETREGG